MSNSWFIYPVSMAIREYLRVNNEGSAAGFFKSYKNFKPSTSYASIARTFWLLKELGLIMKRRSERGKAPIAISYYELVGDRFEDKSWRSPQRAKYPEHFGGTMK